MTVMSWYPKPFGPGDLAGEGALKLLGTPQLDVLTMLVRETAQNSWDARIPGQTPEWEFHALELGPAQADTLRNCVLAERGSGIDLSALDLDRIGVLEISDRGTFGLGGPTRNDQPVPPGTSTNYIDLVLTVGASHHSPGSAGTFGFGKTIAYLASRSHTVVIWSRTKVGSRVESRLVASAVGTNFVDANRSFTGRQWWGAPGGSPRGFHPLTGQAADAIAEKLFATTFEPDETGTSVMIVDPNMRDDLRETAQQAAAAALWNLWPKVLPPPGTRQAPMRLRVRYEGEDIPVPDPLTDSRVRGYAVALQAIRAVDGGGQPNVIPGLTTVHPITFGNAALPMGRMAIDRRPSTPARSEEASEPEQPVDPYSGAAHHLALMRNSAELVVEYLELEPPAVSGIGVCGVFRCDPSTDGEFSLAEPPAHDAWSDKAIQDRTVRSHVRTTLRKIRDTWRSELRPHQPPRSGSNGNVPVAMVSNHLAGLLSGLSGNRAMLPTGTSTTSRKGGRRSGPTSGRVSVTIEASGPVSPEESRVRFRVSGATGPVSLRAEASIGYDGGSERSDQDDSIEIERFQSVDDQSLTVEGDALTVQPDQPDLWDVFIRHPSGTAIDARVRLEP